MAAAHAEQVRHLSASYRTQKGWLSRACRTVDMVVTEATAAVPSRVLQEQLIAAQANLERHVVACENICEELKDFDDTPETELAVTTRLDEDAARALAVTTGLLRELARYEVALAPPAPLPPAPPAPGAAAPPVPAAPPRVVCKPNKDLKPAELQADTTPVEFMYWVDAFEAYHSSSHMEVATVAEQHAYFKNCISCALFGRIQSRIVQGVTPLLGAGATVMGYLKDEFLLEHPLFARRLQFFRFKQQRGQLMSDAVAQLQRLGDQATLGDLAPEDLYVMRYLTMTSDDPLLEKLLEVELPTKIQLRDVIRRFETAARNRVTIAGPAIAAQVVPAVVPAQADAVQGNRRSGAQGGARPRDRAARPERPYTQKQMEDIFAWYRARDLCAKCGKKRPYGEGARHECPAAKNKCKGCLRTGHSDAHCFVDWKPPAEQRSTARASARQTFHEEDASDAESDVSYSSALTRQT